MRPLYANFGSVRSNVTSFASLVLPCRDSFIIRPPAGHLLCASCFVCIVVGVCVFPPGTLHCVID